MTLPRVRIPPSPTGYCHVGTARTALLNFLFARKNGGHIIMRIEDTDRERSTKEFEQDIIDSISWLGLAWDEFYRQSECTDIYANYLQQLLKSGKAYVSEEESKKEVGVMTRLVRLKNPGTRITFNDLVRGDITFDTNELGDFVIARSEHDALYHFAVVVDDAEMRITHVIRGEDHISNTPRQILIQEALGFMRPLYAHFPLNLAADRSKLSKRKGDVSVRLYREKGFLPEALINYLAIIGWTPPSGREILSLDEMIKEFDIKGIHKSGSIFDNDKLRWFNRQYLMRLPDDAFAAKSLPILRKTLEERAITWDENVGKTLVIILRERISVWEDVRTLAAEGEFDFFFADPKLNAHDIPEKRSTVKDAMRHLEQLRTLLADVPTRSFAHADKIKQEVWDYATQEGRGAVLWPLRYSLTGRSHSPDPFAVAAIIGKDAVLNRIKKAIEMLITP